MFIYAARVGTTPDPLKNSSQPQKACKSSHNFPVGARAVRQEETNTCSPCKIQNFSMTSNFAPRCPPPIARTSGAKPAIHIMEFYQQLASRANMLYSFCRFDPTRASTSYPRAKTEFGSGLVRKESFQLTRQMLRACANTTSSENICSDHTRMS